MYVCFLDSQTTQDGLSADMVKHPAGERIDERIV